ncbi:unnamed protein product [Symbiodinium natans]|uniref:Uncharacterized protein n=1 Tax=Symbiodinium natans TaxID=878477 RepID=A0A812M4G7_9DINO|nr:unnamed protein product [Symbiodinium natans]
MLVRNVRSSWSRGHPAPGEIAGPREDDLERLIGNEKMALEFEIESDTRRGQLDQLNKQPNMATSWRMAEEMVKKMSTLYKQEKIFPNLLIERQMALDLVQQ